MHIGVGSNVVCSTGLGNARASVRGTGSEQFPRFFCARKSIHLNNCRLGDGRRKRVVLMKPCLFYGNGINLIGNNKLPKWDKLLEQIAKDYWSCKEQGKKFHLDFDNVPYPLRYEYIYLLGENNNYVKNTSTTLNEEELKRVIKNRLDNQVVNDVYEKMAEAPIEDYITTNFDTNLEKLLSDKYGYTKTTHKKPIEKRYSICRCTELENSKKNDKKRIWHIHGNITSLNSITVGYDQYCGMLTNINRYIKGMYTINGENIGKIQDRLKNPNTFSINSWIDLFFVAPIYMIGIGPSFDEIDIWWLLNKRKRLFNQGQLPLLPKNDIYYYDLDEQENENKKKILERFDVNVINEIGNWDNIGSNDIDIRYHRLYQQALNTLLNNCKKENK